MNINNYVPKSEDSRRRIQNLVEVITRRKTEIKNAENLIVDKKKDVEIMEDNMKKIRIEDAKSNGWTAVDIKVSTLCTQDYRQVKLKVMLRDGAKIAEFKKVYIDNQSVHFEAVEAFIEGRNANVVIAPRALPKFLTFFAKVHKNDYIISSVEKL